MRGGGGPVWSVGASALQRGRTWKVSVVDSIFRFQCKGILIDCIHMSRDDSGWLLWCLEPNSGL